MKMKPGMKKIVLGLFGLIPFVALKSPLAEASQSANCPPSGDGSGTSVAATDVDPQTLAEYQDLIRTNYGVSSDIVNLNYHEESQTVDLSTFDGHTVTVVMREMHTGSPNGEGGS
jgi:hypothetical protein